MEIFFSSADASVKNVGERVAATHSVRATVISDLFDESRSRGHCFPVLAQNRRARHRRFSFQVYFFSFSLLLFAAKMFALGPAYRVSRLLSPLENSISVNFDCSIDAYNSKWYSLVVPKTLSFVSIFFLFSLNSYRLPADLSLD